tara:strand:+ start:1741 stop:2040 length:300 start_codon:yes stop_codon:yes gene_type:complete
MMRKIGWQERLSLMVKKAKLAREESRLRKALGSFSTHVDGDRDAMKAIGQKRCDLTDEIIQIGRWLAQGSRPLIIAPTGAGKGLPTGTLPLTFSNKGAD